MAYTKDNPGIWKMGKQVYPGDIYMVTAADAANNGTYTAGNYFLATTSFTCNIGGISSYYPHGNSSTANWLWVGNQQFPLNTKGNPGMWTSRQKVNPGDIYMVTAADVVTGPSYVAGNYFLANQSFICDSYNGDTYYPYGDNSTATWSWVGNQQYPLNTKGNPGIWTTGQQVNRFDIYMVIGADHANNSSYVAGNYFSANQSFICDAGGTTYPDGNSSTGNWLWVGNQQYPLNTKGNPGIWFQGQKVNPGDIYIVTDADSARNRNYTAGNFFLANKSFSCDAGIGDTYYPYGNSSTGNWSWGGNKKYPLNTKNNPGIWTSGEQVNPGDIYIVTGADAASNRDYVARNYFSANQLFTCDSTTTYPDGDSSTVNWSWVGNQQYPLNTKGNPGIWIDKQQVNPGDIYIVTGADAASNRDYVARNYFSANQLFTCDSTTTYPDGDSSTVNW
ncbi:hypothetical protein, partial [Serratia quinivorans]|uniref:hypothetical protein n=1 Tax=Serratia quinivorans TaxID=137545 RepID=UPI0021BD55D0